MKIWFAFDMTFNTLLFISILFVLLLPECVSAKTNQLPNNTNTLGSASNLISQWQAKLMGFKWKSTHNNTTTTTTTAIATTTHIPNIILQNGSPEDHSITALSANSNSSKIKSMSWPTLPHLFPWNNAKHTTTVSSTIGTTTISNTTTEEVADILGWEDNEDLIVINRTNTLINGSANWTGEATTFHDYELNTKEYQATEPPEMDKLAELVDENGQAESKDEHDGKDEETIHNERKNTTESDDFEETEETDATNETDTTKATEKTSTTTILSINTTTTTITTTTRKVGYGEKIKADVMVQADAIAEKFKQLQLKIQLDKYMKKITCLSYSQDSGYWCDASLVGRLSIRYYYEKTTESCECFLYYGCFGNPNNFYYLRDCENHCKPYTINGIKKSKNTGPCVLTP